MGAALEDAAAAAAGVGCASSSLAFFALLSRLGERDERGERERDRESSLDRPLSARGDLDRERDRERDRDRLAFLLLCWAASSVVRLGLDSLSDRERERRERCRLGLRDRDRDRDDAREDASLLLSLLLPLSLPLLLRLRRLRWLLLLLLLLLFFFFLSLSLSLLRFLRLFDRFSFLSSLSRLRFLDLLLLLPLLLLLEEDAAPACFCLRMDCSLASLSLLSSCLYRSASASSPPSPVMCAISSLCFDLNWSSVRRGAAAGRVSSRTRRSMSSADARTNSFGLRAAHIRGETRKGDPGGDVQRQGRGEQSTGSVCVCSSGGSGGGLWTEQREQRAAHSGEIGD